MVRNIGPWFIMCVLISGCSTLIDNQCSSDRELCPLGYECVRGQCVCLPTCGEGECGDDGCGGTCPPGCSDGESCYEETGTCGAGAGQWITIEAGTFTMGAPTSEAGEDGAEILHEVTLTRSFEMLSTEVTQEEFHSLMGTFIGEFMPGGDAECGLDCPVESVTWHQAAAYCNALSDAASLERCYSCTNVDLELVTCEPATAYDPVYECPGYRLPTEAEWEYAARAGDQRGTYNGEIPHEQLFDQSLQHPNALLDPIAWFYNDDQFWPPVVDVGQLAPNAWGLYDMLGHVREWCHDRADWPDYPDRSVTDPVIWNEEVDAAPSRGCDWSSLAFDCRAASRGYDIRDEAESYHGFRPVRAL